MSFTEKMEAIKDREKVLKYRFRKRNKFRVKVEKPYLLLFGVFWGVSVLLLSFYMKSEFIDDFNPVLVLFIIGLPSLVFSVIFELLTSRFPRIKRTRKVLKSINEEFNILSKKMKKTYENIDDKDFNPNDIKNLKPEIIDKMLDSYESKFEHDETYEIFLKVYDKTNSTGDEKERKARRILKEEFLEAIEGNKKKNKENRLKKIQEKNRQKEKNEEHIPIENS